MVVRNLESIRLRTSRGRLRRFLGIRANLLALDIFTSSDWLDRKMAARTTMCVSRTGRPLIFSAPRTFRSSALCARSETGRMSVKPDKKP